MANIYARENIIQIGDFISVMLLAWPDLLNYQQYFPVSPMCLHLPWTNVMESMVSVVYLYE